GNLPARMSWWQRTQCFSSGAGSWPGMSWQRTHSNWPSNASPRATAAGSAAGSSATVGVGMGVAAGTSPAGAGPQPSTAARGSARDSRYVFRDMSIKTCPSGLFDDLALDPGGADLLATGDRLLAALDVAALLAELGEQRPAVGAR